MLEIYFQIANVCGRALRKKSVRNSFPHAILHIVSRSILIIRPSDLQQIIDNKNIISASHLTFRTFKQTVIRLHNSLLEALNDSSLMTLFPIHVDITITKQICIIISAQSTERTLAHRATKDRPDSAYHTLIFECWTVNSCYGQYANIARRESHYVDVLGNVRRDFIFEINSSVVNMYSTVTRFRDKYAL